MKVHVILENAPGSELERTTIELDDASDNETSDRQIRAALDKWCLTPGDTIRIQEAE